MAIPLRQRLKLGAYLARQQLARRKQFPLIVELEPLFACNLECAGCGKIQYPTDVLRQRVSVEDAVGAMEESGAPMVSIAGGEPLLHPEIGRMVSELVKRKRFVYLCTNAILLKRKIDQFTPSPYFSFVIHVDGLRERHDELVCRDGVFDECVEAIKLAKSRGFRVTTNSTFFNTDSPKTVREVLDFLNDDLEVDGMMVSPGYAYEKAPDQVHFLGVEQTQRLFRDVVRRRAAQEVAAEPHAAVPRLSRGQAGLRVHGVGNPELLGVRMAAAVLPDGRRVREDLPGARRHDRLVEVRARPRPAVRELHGALRLRADGGDRHHQVAEGVAARRGHDALNASRVLGTENRNISGSACQEIRSSRGCAP